MGLFSIKKKKKDGSFKTESSYVVYRMEYESKARKVFGLKFDQLNDDEKDYVIYSVWKEKEGVNDVVRY